MVRAGRFLVHGSHDRDRVPPEAIGIEIEAALAFGTGHHGTTRGCLLMLDAVLKERRPQRVLDVGTGTGVLALAAARYLHKPIAAGDIDYIAVEAAASNARLNGARPWLRPVVAGDAIAWYASKLLVPLGLCIDNGRTPEAVCGT
jgi:ribosomal protein L11 methyltransferase